MTLPIRPELRGLSPYGAPQLDVAALLNVNENPYAPPPSVVDAIAAAVHKDPDPDPSSRTSSGLLASMLSIKDWLITDDV